MKRVIITALVALAALVFTGTVLSDVTSLRGALALDAEAEKPTKKKLLIKEGGIERSYKLQPPSVPHKVAEYKVNLKNNGCMKCHSEKTYEKEKSPRILDSHYIDREGNMLENLSSRRYFCNQCHAPQVDATPLVQNTFAGAK